MWQLIWILEFFPTWLWTLLLVASLVGLTVSKILNHLPSAIYIKVVSIVVLLVSIWTLGAKSNEEKWQEKVKELEEKIATSKEESKEANNQIETKIVEQTKFIKGKTEYITKYIDNEIVKKEEIIKYIEKCPLPKDIIDIHNNAADADSTVKGVSKK